MFTSFLSHLDWLSVGAGALAGMAICRRCISAVKQKNKAPSE